MSDLAPDAVLPRLRGRLGSPYLYAQETASTQDVLRGTDLPEGAVATAEHQVAGRGRSGRRWDDRPGRSLLCSVLLRPPGGALPQLSLVVALAAAEAIELVAGIEARVKWPNDVLVAGGKVAGILLEAGDGAVVAGIGVNVNQSAGELPARTRLPATSLRVATGATHDRGALLAALLERLDAAYASWRASGLDGLAARLEARNALRGQRVSVGAAPGTAGALAPDGRLSVTLDGGHVVMVESGEIEPLDLPL